MGEFVHARVSAMLFAEAWSRLEGRGAALAGVYAEPKAGLIREDEKATTA